MPGENEQEIKRNVILALHSFINLIQERRKSRLGWIYARQLSLDIGSIGLSSELSNGPSLGGMERRDFGDSFQRFLAGILVVLVTLDDLGLAIGLVQYGANRQTLGPQIVLEGALAGHVLEATAGGNVGVLYMGRDGSAVHPHDAYRLSKLGVSGGLVVLGPPSSGMLVLWILDEDSLDGRSKAYSLSGALGGVLVFRDAVKACWIVLVLVDQCVDGLGDVDVSLLCDVWNIRASSHHSRRFFVVQLVEIMAHGRSFGYNNGVDVILF